jgi:hypothetical protein
MIKESGGLNTTVVIDNTKENKKFKIYLTPRLKLNLHTFYLNEFP